MNNFDQSIVPSKSISISSFDIFFRHIKLSLVLSLRFQDDKLCREGVIKFAPGEKMNNPEIDKKLSGAIDEVISIYLESTDVEVIDLFRSLTRHVISLNYQYASNYRSATAMIAQCLNDVMCDLQEQKIFNDEFKDNLKKGKVTSTLEDHLKKKH